MSQSATRRAESSEDPALPSHDVLTSGDDGPGAVEQARRRVWRGVVSGVRRHRGWVVAVAIAGVVAVGVADRWSSRPPPPDPVIRVVLLPDHDLPDDAPILLRRLFLESTPNPGPAGNYFVSVDTPGDVVQVIGVIGPGLTKPGAVHPRAVHGRAQKVTVTAAWDCSQAGWWTATDADYKVLVRRTDAWGRSVTAAVGPPAADQREWREVVQRECMYHELAAASLDRWQVIADRTRHEIQLSLRMRSSAAHPIFVQLAFPLGAAAPSEVRLPPGGASEVTTSWPTRLCPDYHWNLMGLSRPDEKFDVLLLRAAPQPFDRSWSVDADGTDPYQTSLALPHALRVDLVARLDRACIAAR